MAFQDLKKGDHRLSEHIVIVILPYEPVFMRSSQSGNENDVTHVSIYIYMTLVRSETIPLLLDLFVMLLDLGLIYNFKASKKSHRNQLRIFSS